MSDGALDINPAEEASERALAQVYGCLNRKESFLLEAGAGAGKTYSLVKALQFLIKRNLYNLPKRHQKIACITFTNVAKDEVELRTDRSPLIYSDTIHTFCWSLIVGFQKQIRERLPQMSHWPEKIAEAGELGERVVQYTLGHRSIQENYISIHHDDVLLLMVYFMDNTKFRSILTDKYPIILIDEYQDTDAKWIESIKRHFLGNAASPQFGFFGDHWQKIYGNGCGKIDHPSLTIIGKEANFRSVSTIVDCLNRMRPELPQFVVNPNELGSVRVFHTNNWIGSRQIGQHWGGDLPTDVANGALQQVIKRLTDNGWEFSPEKTKILMLTHRVLADMQGYDSLPSVFEYNDSFTRKDHPHIAFFADILEPACEAFLSRKYGEMFVALGGKVPVIGTHADKDKWETSMNQLIQLKKNGTVGEVISHLRHVRRPRLPDALERREQELEEINDGTDQDVPRALTELKELHTVSYREILALCKYLAGHSSFETKHGVKGAEFDNVLVVIGRGWNKYNFNEMLELADNASHIPADKKNAFERNRNLFYVTSSRARKHLAILFTQELSTTAMRTVGHWFGEQAIESLEF